MCTFQDVGARFVCLYARFTTGPAKQFDADLAAGAKKDRKVIFKETKNNTAGKKPPPPKPKYME